MTFRHEASQKNSSSITNKENCSFPKNSQPTAISTIYDPRLQCSEPTSSENMKQHVCISSPLQMLPANRTFSTPRKDIIEKIKKFSCKLYFLKSVDENKRMRFIKLMSLSILLACKIILMIAFLIFMFRTVQKPEVMNIVIDGEFQILNQKFEYDILDKESFAFQSLAFNLSIELNRLFRKSTVGEYFQRSEILEITTNMTVKCIVIFRNSDYVNVGRIGLAFLRGLEQRNGHTLLGVHVINVQSIGFQVLGEEGMWDEWTDWQGCENQDDKVATRSRKCLVKDTNQVTNVDRCLLIPGNKSNVDRMSCEKYRLLQRQSQ